MDLKKSVIILVLAVLAFNAAYAQSKEDAFYSPGDQKSVHLFPNPTTEYVTLKFDAPLARTCRLTLHNVIGNQLEIDSEVLDEFEVRVRVKDFPTGYYFLAVHDENFVARGTYKFLKK